MKPKNNRDKLCKKCQAPFHAYYNEELCQDCIHSLPKCFGCGNVCAPAWGYGQYPYPFTLKKGGQVTLCGDCQKVMDKRGYLLLAGSWGDRQLLADGSIKRIPKDKGEERGEDPSPVC